MIEHDSLTHDHLMRQEETDQCSTCGEVLYSQTRHTLYYHNNAATRTI